MQALCLVSISKNPKSSFSETEGVLDGTWARCAMTNSQIFLQFNIIIFIFKNEYNLVTRYELLNALTLTWNNKFHIRYYAICPEEIRNV